jgi:hypothetical protein
MPDALLRQGQDCRGHDRENRDTDDDALSDVSLHPPKGQTGRGQQ